MAGKKYFNHQLEVVPFYGVYLELRSGVALRLLEHFGIVAGKRDKEDTVGRAAYDLQSPAEAVARCFALADAFVDTAESRGDVQIHSMTDEERSAKIGKLERIKTDAMYRLKEEKAVESANK